VCPDFKQYQRTPLHVAAWEGFTDVCRCLVEDGGATVNVVNRVRVVRSHGAACTCYTMHTCPSWLLSLQYKETPLHKAAASGHTDVCRFLVEAGIDVSAGNSVSVCVTVYVVVVVVVGLCCAGDVDPASYLCSGCTGLHSRRRRRYVEQNRTSCALAAVGCKASNIPRGCYPYHWCCD
jgi:ankyrin repeat protein